MKLIEEKLSSEEIFSGRVIHVTLDTVSVGEKDSGVTASREIVAHHGGVCCLAFNDRDEIAIVRQFRYAMGEVVAEIPAGKLEPGEDPFGAVQRELREETGAVGKNWRSLGRLYPTPGFCSEIDYMYTCDIEKIGATDFDEDENLECEYIPFAKAVEMAMAGEFPDATTQTAILKLAVERGMKVGVANSDV